MIKGVIFDYDGVIADTRKQVLKANRRVFEIFGKGTAASDEEVINGSSDWRSMYRNLGFTDGDSRRIYSQLGKNNLVHYFDFIVGLEADKHKPDPYQLHLCMRGLCISPAEICYVGDTSADIYVSNPQELLRALEALQ